MLLMVAGQLALLPCIQFLLLSGLLFLLFYIPVPAFHMLLFRQTCAK